MLYIHIAILASAAASLSTVYLIVLYITESVSESARLIPKDTNLFVLLDPGALEMHHLL